VSLLEWLSQTSLSIWIREGDTVWAYPMVITFHSAGLAVMVGLSVVIALRIMGVARGLPLAALRSLYPMMWLGFGVNALSGFGLILADPIGMLTNPLLYMKLLLIAAAIVCLVRIERHVLHPSEAPADALPSGAKGLALATLMLWAAATTVGRFTAYIGSDTL
jgi:hypothetical protein